MERVMFDECVGWLHEGAGATGVVLCAPFGHEAMWSHRAMRFLADGLANAGVPVLRFDYPGTGDAAGPDSAADDINATVHSITRAAQVLRERSGVRDVVLCGVRMGSLLAVLAAEAMATDRATAVSGLALLAPPVNGRAYLRELRALQLNWLNNAIPDIRVESPTDGSCDVLGYRLSAPATALVEAVRLDRRPVCPAPRVLLLDPWPGAMSPVQSLASHYGAQGADVQVAAFDGYPEMMRSADASEVPAHAWQAVTSWVTAATPVRPRSVPASAAGAGIAPSTSRTGDILELPGVVEQPVWLAADRLFGILCSPAERKPGGTAVIFPNTGGNHHVGDCRVFVSMSRMLARLGVTALRLDISVLGDSARPKPRLGIPVLYDTQPRDDVSGAVDWIRANGYERIVLVGVCSGAYHALHAALGNANVTGVVLVNLAKFRWERSDIAASGRPAQSMRVYRAALRNPRNWQKLFLGRLNFWPHAIGFMRGIAGRIASRCARRILIWRGGEDASTATGFARATMRELDRRGVQVDFLYGEGDQGLEDAHERFGRDFAALEAFENVRVRVLPQVDHALFLAHSRAAVTEHLVRHVEIQQQAAEREMRTSGAVEMPGHANAA